MSRRSWATPPAHDDRRAAGARTPPPAIALAALRLPDDAVMLVCPSDHHIGDPRRIRRRRAGCRRACRARAGWSASGSRRPRPRPGSAISGGARRLARRGLQRRAIRRKARSRATAQGFLAEGGYAWNGGIFAFRAGTFLAELEAHRPEIAAAVRDAVASGHEQTAAGSIPMPSAFAAIEQRIRSTMR